MPVTKTAQSGWMMCAVLLSVVSGFSASPLLAQSNGSAEAIVAQMAGGDLSNVGPQELVEYYQFMISPTAGLDPSLAQDFLLESVREWFQQQNLTPQEAVDLLAAAFANNGGMPERFGNTLLAELATTAPDYTPPAYIPDGPVVGMSRPDVIAWPYFDPTFLSAMSRLSDLPGARR